MKQRIIKNPDESPFIGVFTPLLAFVGNKKRTLEAETKKLATAKEVEDSKRATLEAEADAAERGFNPEKDKALAALKIEETKANSEKIIFAIVAFIVVSVMAGLYFIKKR